MINSRSLKFVIISLIFTLFTFGNTKSINSSEIKESAEPPGPVGRFGPNYSVTDYNKQKAKEAEAAYEQRNANITSWIENDTPLKPDNAALLYYQAFLLRPEPMRLLSTRYVPRLRLMNRSKHTWDAVYLF